MIEKQLYNTSDISGLKTIIFFSQFFPYNMLQ